MDNTVETSLSSGISNEEHPIQSHNRRSVGRDIVFFSQIFIITVVIIASIVNLSLSPTKQTELWVALLSTSLGAVLPSPKLKRKTPQL